MEGKWIQRFCLREIKIRILGKEPAWGLMNRQCTRRGVAQLPGMLKMSFSPHREWG